MPCSPHLFPLSLPGWDLQLGGAGRPAFPSGLMFSSRAGGAVQIPSRAQPLMPPHPSHTHLCHLLTCKVISQAHPLGLAGWGQGRRAVSQADAHSPFLREGLAPGSPGPRPGEVRTVGC